MIPRPAGVSDDLFRRLCVAVEAAEEAGRGTLDLFAAAATPGLTVDTKADGSPVTEADRRCERQLRDVLLAAFPDDGLLGEEYGEPAPGTSGYRWIIDPIDGTFSFTHGVPLYATLLACERVTPPTAHGADDSAASGGVLVGVAVLPALGETVFAARGCGAWRRVSGGAATRARVSATRTLREATVVMTSLDYFRTPADRAVFERVVAAAGHSRGWSDAYAGMLVATGRADAVFEPAIKAWDVAPFEVILQEAGGRATDWEGRSGCHRPTFVGSNGLVHDELLRVIAGGRG